MKKAVNDKSGNRFFPVFLILILIVTNVLLFFSCQKSIFNHIEVSGRLVNFITKEPAEGSLVELYGDGRKSGGMSYYVESAVLSTVTTKSDGTFSLRSRTSKYPGYYLHVDGNKFDLRPDTQYSQIIVSPTGKNNLGDIVGGSFNFVVEVTLTPITDNSIWLFKLEYFSENKDKYYHFDPQTNKKVYLSKKLSYAEYIKNPAIVVSYRVDNSNSSDYYITPNKSITTSLHGGDTMKVSIAY